MSELKVLFVTSRVTYMPNNYFDLFEEFLKLNTSWVKGLVLLDNLDKKTLVQVIGLPFLGAKKIGLQLLRNIWELPSRQREVLFESKNIPILNWKSMNDPEAIDFVERHSIDIIVNLRTRCIYKKEILNAPNMACLNIHHGLLPRYRGTLCDLYALTENREAGFSIHEMDEKIDAGKLHAVVPVAKKEDVMVKGKYDYLEYLKRTGKLEAQELYELLSKASRNGRLPQGSPNVSDKKYFSKNPTKAQIKKFIKEGFAL